MRVQRCLGCFGLLNLSADVNDLDVSSLKLAGVSPIRTGFEDVAAPVPGDPDSCECTTLGPDGLLDLTLKFNKCEVALALGPAGDGEFRVVTLTGNTLDGTPFEASDCVRMQFKGNGRPNLASTLGSEITLGDAWPNPFNPVTRISYSVPEAMPVRLAIYDVTGRLVELLVDGTRSAGEHFVTWEAKNVPSGIYFYRLEAASVVETRKMILLK